MRKDIACLLGADRLEATDIYLSSREGTMVGYVPLVKADRQ